MKTPILCPHHFVKLLLRAYVNHVLSEHDTHYTIMFSTNVQSCQSRKHMLARPSYASLW